MTLLIVFLIFIIGILTFISAFTMQKIKKEKLKELQAKNLELQQQLVKQEEANIEQKMKAKEEMEGLQRKIAKKDQEEAELKTKIENLEARVSYYKDNQGQSYVERRKFSRLVLAVGIDYKIMGNKISPIDMAQSRNISAGGICLTIGDQVEIGDVLSLDINLPGGKGVINTKGVVKWRNFVGAQNQKSRWDIGVEFLDISDKDREQIAKYVFVTL